MSILGEHNERAKSIIICCREAYQHVRCATALRQWRATARDLLDVSAALWNEVNYQRLMRYNDKDGFEGEGVWDADTGRLEGMVMVWFGD